MNKPLVSVITATYNSEAFVLETIASIRNQTFDDWELLITDDCSTDGTFQLLEEAAAEDLRVKVFKLETNGGAGIARNHSIAQAKGRFIAFCDSDDLWMSEKLERQMAFMGSGVNFSFTAYELVDEAGKALRKIVDGGQDGSFEYKDMLKKKATLGCSTVMIRKGAYPDLMMPLLRTGQDYAFWLKLLKTGSRAHLLSKVLTQYRITPNSISRNKVKKAKRRWEIYRKVEKLPFLYSVVCFCFYAWRAVFRK